MSELAIIGNVIASDGTVWSYWEGSQYWSRTVESLGDHDWLYWENYAPNSKNYFDEMDCLGYRTENWGFFAYKYGMRIQLENQIKLNSTQDGVQVPTQRTTRQQLLQEARNMDMKSIFWEEWLKRRQGMEEIDSQYVAS